MKSTTPIFNELYNELYECWKQHCRNLVGWPANQLPFLEMIACATVRLPTFTEWLGAQA